MRIFTPEGAIFLLEAIEAWTYPALYSISLVLFLISIFTLSLDGRILLVKLTEFVPLRWVRIPGAILILSILLIMPVATGVLMALVLWGVVIFMFLRHRKYLGLAIGLLMLGWGTMIPLREQVAAWRADREIQLLVKSYSEPISRTETWRFQWLLDERSEDPLVIQAYSRFLRETGEYDRSLNVLAKAAESFSDKGWIYAESGLISYLKRDFEKAEDYYQQAYDSGFRSPEMYYNWSRLKFEAMDLAGSSEMYERALNLDREVTLKYFERESSSGALYADFMPPARAVLLSAAIPAQGVARISQEFAWQLTPLGKNLSYWCFSFTGVVYILAFLALIGYRPERSPHFFRKPGSIFTRVGYAVFIILFWGAGSIGGLDFTMTYFLGSEGSYSSIIMDAVLSTSVVSG